MNILEGLLVVRHSLSALRRKEKKQTSKVTKKGSLPLKSLNLVESNRTHEQITPTGANKMRFNKCVVLSGQKRIKKNISPKRGQIGAKPGRILIRGSGRKRQRNHY